MRSTNTHIMVPEFDYVEPDTLDEVLFRLSDDGSPALIAGGTDLLVQMKLERQSAARLISLAGVPELGTIAIAEELVVGATTSILSVARSDFVRGNYAALAEACDSFSTAQITIMATIGGNLCNASPAADTAPPLLAFDALVKLVSRAGERVLPLEDLFLGPGLTALRNNEVLRSIHLKEPAVGTGSAFMKIGRVAADISKVCVAVRLVREQDHISECGIALGSVAPTPIRVRRAEEYLIDQRLDVDAVREAARLASEQASPISDVRSTEEYRRHVVGIVVRDALARAWVRAGGGELS